MLYRFTDEVPASQLDRIVAASLRRRLWIDDSDYPDTEAWGQRAYLDLKSGSKFTMVAFNHRAVAGSVIWRLGEEEPSIVDIRRIAMKRDEEGRGIAKFLLRSTEVEAVRRFPGAEVVRVDAKVSNLAIRAFLYRCGYVLDSVQDLYGLGTGLDAIYRKSLVPTPRH